MVLPVPLDHLHARTTGTPQRVFITEHALRKYMLHVTLTLTYGTRVPHVGCRTIDLIQFLFLVLFVINIKVVTVQRRSQFLQHVLCVWISSLATF